MTEIIFEGFGEVNRRLRALGPGVPKSVSVALHEAASLIASDSRFRILRGKKSGNIYRVPNAKRRYRASAPGEAPANRTGHLASHIQPKLEAADTAEVQVPVVYAGMLENGTSRMAARPFLAVAMDAQRENVVKRLLNALEKEFSR